ncbi:BON domain-containing protein [Aestuariibacter halophilus]|uniref:BON domain-containing protein n=1 Tax=Fluctibacter halophilus TaxID=226011 RepID=A0ABS8GET2_9ALTE|nr:BON domain-containing protein [Aestuariibacter halophilus]MCC2618294.1 BON domain-containing protein [Aestuariibacter halophilus]
MLKGSRAGIALLLVSALLLQGCAALVVGAGVGAASVVHDRRTLGTQVDDKTTAGRIVAAINEDEALSKQANINVHVFNGVALLTGQTPSEAMRQSAEQRAATVPNVRKLHNQIRVAQPIGAGTVTNDVWLSSKVRANLLSDKRIDGLHISVTVEDSEVFLMGLVKANEADVAVEVARNVNGVARVVKAFDYL